MAENLKNTFQGNTRKQQKKELGARRIQIASILGIVASVVVLLSILSYRKYDEQIVDRLSVVDVFRIPFDDRIQSIAGEIQNRFGLIGALVADFFINSTVGFASIALPLLCVMWGWVLLSRREKQKPITITNYAILLILIFSTTAGVVGQAFDGVEKEWSGVMGAYAADILTRLLGVVGSLILMITTLFVTVVFAIDLDVHKSVERFRAAALSIVTWFRQRRESKPPFEELDEYEDVVIKQGGEDQFNPRRREVVIASRNSEEDEMAPAFEREEPNPSLSFYDEAEQGEEDSVANIPSKSPQAIPQSSPNASPSTNEEVIEEIDYVFPSVELLDPTRQADAVDDVELKANAELVRSKLARFGVEIESVSVTPGPVITLYELVPASGVKISRIVALADDLALALAAKGIRIMAPIPGKSAVGVEIPNRNPSMVSLRSVLNSTKFRESKASLPIALGKTIAGDILVDDLAKMPHLLIAGSTGSGKSVGINTILASLLFKMHPSEVKFIVIDPKKIELTQYGRLKQHFLAISPDINEEIVTTPENAVSVLKSVELEMEKRYDRLAAAGVRNIQDYNDRLKAGRLKNSDAIVHRKMPFLIVVIDELADLMMTAAKEVEAPIARLAQLARAVGIHLVLATQRPSVDVITGVIKANFPARIAYQVASKTDSRTILDMNGAEQLLGSGDMLYLPSGTPKPMRIQNAYVSTEEVERLTDHIAKQQGYSRPFPLPSILERKASGMRGGSRERDEFFEEAARLIVRHQQGSVSLLQRRLKVGYSRAARLVDELEAAGIVGPFDGSKARLVLVDSDDQLDRILETLESI